MERITFQDLPNGMFEHLMNLEKFINDSPLDMQLLELIRLRVGQLNACAYCVDMHHKELQHLGETDLRLSSLCVWQEAPYFSDKERAALTFTEVLTRIDEDAVSDGTYGTLSPFFNKEEISYLSLAIAQINTWTRLMKTFRFTPGQHQVQ